jgi:hypothetical protein|eukprot:COSAG03_NODE_4319_length_1596_cov_1.144289_2_plen_201_part_00
MVPAQKDPEPQPGSPDEDSAAKAKSRDRDVGKKQKIRLLLPLVRTRGLSPPSSAGASQEPRPARPSPLEHPTPTSGEDSGQQRTGERPSWSSEEVSRYDEGADKFGPTVSSVTRATPSLKRVFPSTKLIYMPLVDRTGQRLPCILAPATLLRCSGLHNIVARHQQQRRRRRHQSLLPRPVLPPAEMYTVHQALRQTQPQP